MSFVQRPALRIRAAVAAVAIAVAVVACQAGGSTPPTSGPGTASTLQPTAAPTAPTATAVVASAAVRLFGPLAAGTYTTATFTPAVTFTVPAGWIAGSENADSFSIHLASDKFHQLTFARVVDGDALGIARVNPIYQLGSPVSTTIAGKSATEVSLVLPIDAIQKSFYPLATTASGGEGTLDLLERGTQARVITVEVSGGPLVVLIQRPLTAADSFDAAAQAVLDSLHLP